MDLRIQKTKAAIKAAFLELRRRKPIEKLTVTELSKLAEINKATFYLHYSDIYSLADELEDEAIDDILARVPCLLGQDTAECFAGNQPAYRPAS